ncbi:MAG TPA: heparinase II/III family protein [Chthonomonadaceae bacterium]|nr:heparinase II/III family protein [Chthonomonadaceae bacterium]
MVRKRRTKAASLTTTAADRANAVRNAGRFAWAAAERDAAQEAAAPWRLLDEDTLWALIPGQELPRSIHIVNVYGTDKIALCPNCQDGIIPYGNYPWLTDVFRCPWKIECPHCHEVFPKNDFGAYYRSALDAQGLFRRSQGDARLLFNMDHPDPADPLHTHWVDDGYGWRDADGQRWDFIAVYAQWGLWAQIKAGIEALARAYTLTGDPDDAHRCGMLLARLADVYPEMDWWPLYQQGFSHSDGGCGRGRVEGCIWECANGKSWSLAYDRIFDALIKDTGLACFVDERHAQAKLPSLPTPRRLCEHIERGLIEEIVAGVKDGRLRGNPGMHQAALIAAALALDRPEETPGLIDWAFAPGSRAPDPDRRGRDGVTGGDLEDVLVSRMDRDGLGDEGAPGYAALWGASLLEIADILENNSRYRSHSLYRDYPKFRQIFHAGRRWTCLDAATPPIGDSGSTGAWNIVGPDAAALLRAFAVYRDPDLARHAVRLLDNRLEEIHGSIFDSDPAALRRHVDSLVHGYPPPFESRLMDGFGLAILQAPYRKHGRAVWLYFGRNTGHGHLDRLNLGLYAENIDMLPDLGYPEYASGRPRDLAWTRNNAAHNVPIVDGAAQLPSYTGHVRAFEPEGKVRLVEVESDGIYAGASQTRRTVWMVDVDTRRSYVVDIVRLRGGAEHMLGWHGPSDTVTTDGLTWNKQKSGSFAGPGVPPEMLAPDWKDHAGFSFLYNVARDSRPPASFCVDYRAEDGRGRIAPGHEPHLRLHLLTALQEAAIADGDPPQNRQGAPRRLKYLLLTRRGVALESVFVTVLEPYDREPFLRSARLVPAHSDTPGADPVAVEIVTADGRVDTLLTLDTGGICAAEEMRMEGKFGFLARREGAVELAKLMGGTRLEGPDFLLTAATAAYSGVIKDVLFSDPADQRLRLSAPPPPPARRLERLLLVANDGVQDATYTVTGWPRPNVASLGATSLVRGFKDKMDPAQGYHLNVNPGDAYTIPTFVSIEDPGSAVGRQQANVPFQAG